MWIIPSNHPLYSHFAPACVDSKEGLKDFLPSHFEPSLMWKSKPLSLKTWYNKWNRVYWLPHLFGRMLKPSHGRLFTEKYTGSLADIRANHSVTPDSGQVQMILDTFGRILKVALKNRGLWGSSLKMSRPMGVFFENVEGHISLGLRDVLTDLRKLGYQVEIGLFSAAEVGAPHRRNRVFILGMENSFLLGMRGWSNVEREDWRRKIQIARSGSMENSDSKSMRNNIERIYTETTPTSIGCLAYSNIPRSSVPIQAQLGSIYKTSESLSRCEYGRRNSKNWPSGPGSQQYTWEASRVESSVGYAVNGYNFREDLLRMAGNAVVEQQSEHAFRTLIQKFL